jgi:hypothetical protein
MIRAGMVYPKNPLLTEMEVLRRELMDLYRTAECSDEDRERISRAHNRASRAVSRHGGDTLTGENHA